MFREQSRQTEVTELYKRTKFTELNINSNRQLVPVTGPIARLVVCGVCVYMLCVIHFVLYHFRNSARVGVHSVVKGKWLK